MLGDALTKIEECTPQLRWVPANIFGFDKKLQQAWKVTLLDDKSKPYRQDIEWRDVPFEHTQS